jgi:hypothetical protein
VLEIAETSGRKGAVLGIFGGLHRWANCSALLAGGSHQVLLVCVPHDEQSTLLRLASSKGVPVYLDPAIPHRVPSHREFASSGLVSLHLSNRTLRVTPAMAAGVTDHLWSASDLVDLLEAEEVAKRAA